MISNRQPAPKPFSPLRLRTLLISASSRKGGAARGHLRDLLDFPDGAAALDELIQQGQIERISDADGVRYRAKPEGWFWVLQMASVQGCTTLAEALVWARLGSNLDAITAFLEAIGYNNVYAQVAVTSHAEPVAATPAEPGDDDGDDDDGSYDDFGGEAA